MTSSISKHRALRVVDVENLVGASRATPATLRATATKLHRIAPRSPRDHEIVGTDPRLLLAAATAWPGARYLLGRGPSGADRELAQVLHDERIEQRFDHVVIASGDGQFAPVAAMLASQGCRVTVIARRGCLSRRLQLAAGEVRYLHLAPLAPVSPAARRWAA
jgi:hypothetical protein